LPNSITQKINTSNSPDERTENKTKVKTGISTSKGLNIIPLKNLNLNNNNVTNSGDKSDRLSPKNLSNSKTVLNNISNLSPRNNIGSNIKLPSTTKHSQENKINFEVKTTYKSPSPNRGTNSTTSKYLKKSPEIKK
jgi:hypothetical protein